MSVAKTDSCSCESALTRNDESMQPSVEADLLEMAHRVIETNRYMTLATVEPDGTPRLSPVRFVADGLQICTGRRRILRSTVATSRSGQPSK